jgi:hypothetical protein
MVVPPTIAGVSVVPGGGGGQNDAAAQNLIKLARAWYLKHYHEGANNFNPFTQHVMPTHDPNQPWCAAFVSTMLEQAHIPGISRVMFSAGCIELASQFDHAGRYFASGTRTPQPGDVIFFGGHGSEHHTGIVERVQNGQVWTIEGNSGDQVSEHHYSLSDPGIGGYGRTFGSPVSNSVSGNLGFDTSGSSAAGGGPIGGGGGSTSRSTVAGGGTSGTNTATGLDPVTGFQADAVWLQMLIAALESGSVDDADSALMQMFPNMSAGDLKKLATLLVTRAKDRTARAKLEAALRKNPQLLQQLAADPSLIDRVAGPATIASRNTAGATVQTDAYTPRRTPPLLLNPQKPLLQIDPSQIPPELQAQVSSGRAAMAV